jgi:exonuclease VII small subunit
LAALEESIQTLDFESALARLGDLVHALETGDEAQTST